MCLTKEIHFHFHPFYEKEHVQKKEGIIMLKNSKRILAIALAAMFFSAPLISTASAAAAPDFATPMQLELRGNHHGGPSHGKAPSHSVHRDNGHRGPSHSVKHSPRPQPMRHDHGKHKGHRQPPPPPPRHEKHHHHSSGNDKLIGGLIVGAVIGAVIANNT